MSWRRGLLAMIAVAGCARGVALAPDSARVTRVVDEMAAELAHDSASARARYNLGTALLLAQRYSEAREQLLRATSAVDSLIRQHASYNVGNTDLEPVHAGAVKVGREESLRRAIEAYKQALLTDPGDADAKWNLELARRLLSTPPESPPPPESPDAGGGGGGGGEGGGGGSDPQAGRQDPREQPAGGGGSHPELSPEAAERLLASAQEREAGIQEEKLRKPQPRDPTAH